MMAMGIVAATVGLSQPASPSIGAPFSSVFAPARAILGIVYWTVLTLVGSTMVVKVRNGAVYGSFIAFVVAAAVLGGPPAAVVVGLVGTLELRELRELRPPQIATNHVEPVVGAVVASFAAGWVAEGLTQTSIGSAALAALIVTATATLAFMLPSTALAYVGLALRRRRSLREVAREQLGTILLFSLVAAATAWVMVETYVLVAWWSPIVILGPVLASWLALDRDRARWQADHDPLTQLANRSLFEGKLAVAERRARRDSRSSLILFVDLDGFKAVNDEHGHSVGDDVLRAVARRLEGAIRRGDVVARLGGDEFAVLMWDIADPQLAERTAARLRLELAQPTSSGPIEISIGASVGTSILSREMPAAADAMRLADASLYMDKRKRSGG
jgi:diguanylate cyclase (GGDEF)-like protein